MKKSINVLWCQFVAVLFILLFPLYSFAQDVSFTLNYKNEFSDLNDYSEFKEYQSMREEAIKCLDSKEKITFYDYQECNEKLKTAALIASYVQSDLPETYIAEHILFNDIFIFNLFSLEKGLVENHVEIIDENYKKLNEFIDGGVENMSEDNLGNAFKIFEYFLCADIFLSDIEDLSYRLKKRMNKYTSLIEVNRQSLEQYRAFYILINAALKMEVSNSKNNQ